jgi:hypothetical protein
VKADISRDTFVAAKHYRGVRKQQGRVDVEADWNEQADILDHLLTGTTGDVVGRSGGPLGNAAFGLSAGGAGGSDLRLSGGTYYVDGIRCEAAAEFSVWQQPQVPAGAPIVRLADGTDVAGPTPPAGRYLAYLAVRTRLVTALEDQDIREVALGGPDTAARVQTVWQVRLLRLGSAGDAVDCTTVTPQWTALTATPTGTLEVRAQPGDEDSGPCAVPAGAGFRLLRNNNYRVEIVRSGQPGTARYVWSRDNGSTVASWTGRDGNLLTLALPGRDRLAGFEPGALVELTDDEHDLLGEPGFFTTVVRVAGDRIEVAAPDTTPELDITRYRTHPKVRVWDSGAVATVARPAANGGWIDVEGGVQIRYTGGAATYAAGTFWNAPARTLIGDVLWPRDGTTPRALPPSGADTRFARLGLATFDGTAWTALHDCRPLFAPLTAQTQLAYVSGDGQDALPVVGTPAATVPLRKPIVVGVTNGSVPVVGARVQFTVTSGTGTVNGATTFLTTTDIAGLASANWSVDSATPSQQVTATLFPDGGPTGLPVIFTAELSAAARVAYEPGACPPLAAATTVQEAIDTLCATVAAGCASLTVAPGNGLTEVLEQLAPGQDAHVCLQPGEYPLARTVHLDRLGHLKITGAGEATRIVGEKLEVVLLVTGCESVEISELSVLATAVDVTLKSATPGVRWGDGIGGAITILDTPRVRVDRVAAECAGATSYGAACLTVRRDTSELPLESVRVTACDLRVGHRQAGVLIADADRARVLDTRVTVVDSIGIPGPSLLAADQRTRAALAGRLILAPLVSPVDVGPVPDRNTVLRIGDFVVRLQSAVTAAEWRSLIATDPPAAAETVSADAVKAYVDRVTAATIEEPTRLPSFRGQLTRLRRTEAGRGFLETEAGRRFVEGIIVGGDLEILPVGELAGQRRAVTLASGDRRIRFDSPLPAEEWQAMLRLMPATRLRSASDLLRHARRIAKRVVADAEFRGRFPRAVGWFGSLEGQQVAAASYGVVCGGTVLGDLTVSGVTMTGVHESVHIGLSGAGENPASAGTVRVVDVTATMAVPLDQGANMALFVGNARHVVIRDAVLIAPADRVYRNGIEVQGVLGPMLSVRFNRLERFPQTGIRVLPLAGSAAPAQWAVTDNLTLGAVIAVAAPATVRQADNVS